MTAAYTPNFEILGGKRMKSSIKLPLVPSSDSPFRKSLLMPIQALKPWGFLEENLKQSLKTKNFQPLFPKTSQDLNPETYVKHT